MNISTYLVIKPSAKIAGSAHIFDRVKRLRLDQVSRVSKLNVWISPEQVGMLYPNSPGPILEQTVEEMTRRLSVIRFETHLESANIVKRIALLRGSHTNPVLCERETLRWEVSQIIPSVPKWLEGEYVYYPNFVHVPQNDAEIEICERIFGSYFK